MTTTSLHDFRLAAISHLAAAKKVLDAPDEKAPAKTPSTAAYLATVSLECVLKARILFRGGCESVEKLREKHARVYRALFTSAEGHAVESLAQHLRLEELLKSEGKGAPQADIWKRLSHSERPYSLRYGSEHLSVEDAAAEVAEVDSLHAPLLAGLKLSSKKTSKPKRTRKP
jgi:hypothetical protein